MKQIYNKLRTALSVMLFCIAPSILLAQTKALELKACLALLTHSTDGSDGNLATLNNILASLV